MIDLGQGSLRERVDADELRELKKRGAVFLDPRRTRPMWFDGRFLKAQDLNREQEYFLTRQADLAVATGTGVVDGLYVNQGKRATTLIIRKGYGMTFCGERVMIAKDLNVDLGNVPLIQRLNVRMGLSKEPAPTLRARTGLYIMALRALEYTANPVASYPTHVDAERSVEDGEIIEATAVTLIPFSLSAEFAQPELRRAAVADRVFVSAEDINAPASSLPLAMIELEHGNVRWVDNYLVRRDMGSESSDVLGLGMAPRPLREAHFHQYQAMLHDVLEQRRSLGNDARFAASEHFVSLPPAGELPAAAINMKTLTQHYFPAAMDVEVAIVPEDEAPAVIEESLLLPPIDLNAAEDTLEATSIMVMVPIKRHELSSYTRRLKSLSVKLNAAKINPLHVRPIERIHGIRTKLPGYIKPATLALDLDEANWRSLVASFKTLWYVRRRNLNYKEEVVGESIRILTDEFDDEADMLRRFKVNALDDRFSNLKLRGSAAADLSMVKLLSSPRFTESKSLLLSAMSELEATEILDEKAVVEIAERYNKKGSGEGVRRVENAILEKDTRDDGTTIKAAADRNKSRVIKLGDSKAAPEMDYIASKMKAEEFEKFNGELKLLLDDKDKQADAVTELILNKKRSLEQ